MGPIESPSRRQVDARRALNKIAFAQAGYFSAAQAREVGYSYQAQKYHVDRGNWMRVWRGIFRLPEWPGEATDSLALWSVWSGGRGVISHESALAVHELSDVNPVKVHLTVPHGFRAKSEAVRTHPSELPPEDVEMRSGFLATSVERTLFDVAAVGLSQDMIDAAVREAVEAGSATVRRLRRRAASAPDKAALGIERALSLLEQGK